MVAGIAIMGSDMLYWNYYKGVMDVVIFYLLYMAACC